MRLFTLYFGDWPFLFILRHVDVLSRLIWTMIKAEAFESAFGEVGRFFSELRQVT